MKLTEILRLVWLNLSANKSKVILTSTGIIVGAATIMLVIAIGTGGREEVAEQFRNCLLYTSKFIITAIFPPIRIWRFIMTILCMRSAIS